jgi:hypothetical protein
VDYDLTEDRSSEGSENSVAQLEASLPSPTSQSMGLPSDEPIPSPSRIFFHVLLRLFLFANALVGLILLVIPSSLVLDVLPAAIVDHRTQGSLYIALIMLASRTDPRQQSSSPSSSWAVSAFLTGTITLSNLLRSLATEGTRVSSTWVWICVNTLWLFALVWHHRGLFLLNIS